MLQSVRSSRPAARYVTGQRYQTHTPSACSHAPKKEKEHFRCERKVHYDEVCVYLRKYMCVFLRLGPGCIDVLCRDGEFCLNNAVCGTTGPCVCVCVCVCERETVHFCTQSLKLPCFYGDNMTVNPNLCTIIQQMHILVYHTVLLS